MLGRSITSPNESQLLDFNIEMLKICDFVDIEAVYYGVKTYYMISLTLQYIMQNTQSKLRGEGSEKSKQKSFSNRNVCTHLPPYSHQYLKAKQKAFENYKKVYPVQDKENLYPLSKNPCIGYYVMKGYRYDQNSSTQLNGTMEKHPKSSQKIITNMLKKYLHRKQYAEFKQQEALPKIQHSLSVNNPTNRTSVYSRPRKQTYTRVLTQFDENADVLKPVVTTYDI